MKTATDVKTALLASIHEIAANPEEYVLQPGKDFTRNRKIGMSDLLLSLLTMEADCMQEEIYRYYGRTTDAPTKSAFYKQRKKLKDDAPASLLHSFNGKLPTQLYKGRYQLVACDGSSVDIARDPNDSDTFFEPSGKSPRGYNQVHINALFSILDRRFLDLVIQPGRKQNEYAAFCQLVDAAGHSPSPIIYLADMGFASYNNFAHVIENGQFFLIRCNDSRLEGILGHPVDGLREMDCRVDRILSRTHSRKKHSRPDQFDRYRYVSRIAPMDYIADDSDEYDIHLRIVRFEIKPGCFENIVTNLPDLEFDFEDFKELYHLRWDEENAFRDIKYPLCLKAFHSKKYAYIMQEIWMRAILHNFCSAIVAIVQIEKRDTKHEYQANFSQASKICRDFLRLRDAAVYMDVGGLIVRNIEPIRPGRTFARQHRFHIPISFCYRN